MYVHNKTRLWLASLEKKGKKFITETMKEGKTAGN
jgi:hypothetical protein